MIGLKALTLLWLALPLDGCLDYDSVDYFQLNNSDSWLDNIHITHTLKPAETLRSAIVNPYNDQTITVYPQQHENGLNYYYTRNKNGDIKHLGIKHHGQDAINYIPDNHIVIKTPIEPSINWSVYAFSQLLIRRDTFVRNPLYQDNLRHNIPFAMDYTIIAVDDQISTSSVFFADFLHIKGRGHSAFSGSEVKGDSFETSVASEKRYSPSIGLVKSVYEEKTSTKLFGINRFNLDLIDYHRPWFL